MSTDSEDGLISEAARCLRNQPELRAKLTDLRVFQRLIQTLPKYEDHGHTFYVAESDIAYDYDTLLVYAAEREAEELQQLLAQTKMKRSLLTGQLHPTQEGEPPQELGPEIALHAFGNKPDCWSAQEAMNLSYCIVKDDFSSSEYELLQQGMKQAANDWEAVCHVDFSYKQEFDSLPGVPVPTDRVTFNVRKLNTNNAFFAASFYPSHDKSQRSLRIDPSYFTASNPYNRVGVLRHELGHILGFVHQHELPNANKDCPKGNGPGPFIDLATVFDNHSVMHYLCKNVQGVGSTEMKLTALDQEGARKVYPKPA